MAISTPRVNGLKSTGLESRFNDLNVTAHTFNNMAAQQSKKMAQTIIETMVQNGIIAAAPAQPHAEHADKSSIQNELQGKLETHLSLLLQEHPLDDHKEEAVTKAIGQAINAMTDTTYVDMKHMTKAASDELLNVAKQASNFIVNPNYHLTLSAVFGGTRDECRMRAVSYVLAPLEALDKLLALKKNMNDTGVHTGQVTMKLLSAHNAAIKMNGYDQSIEKNAKAIFSTVQKYIEATRPHLKGSEAIQYAYDSMEQETEFLDTAFEVAAKAVPDDIVTQLRNMGLKHGGEAGAINSVRYGLLHPFVSGDFSVARPGETTAPVHDTGIVSYGGSPEKRFNALRKIVAGSLLEHQPHKFIERHDISRVISLAGERAVYYKTDDTDLSMLEAAAHTPEPKYSRLIKKDVALIKNDLGLHVGEQIGLLTLNKSKQPENDVVDRENSLKKRIDANLSRVLSKPKIWKREVEQLKQDYLAQADNSSIFHETNVRTLNALIKKGPFNKVDKVQTAIEEEMYPLLTDILMQPSPNIQAASSLLP